MFLRRRLQCLELVLSCCLCWRSWAVSALRPEIVKVTVDDTIQPISAEYIDRAIAQRKQTNADAVLIEINTPGGLVDSTRDIIQKILASPVPVIVYVTPTGARAASAGFFILESADVAAMAPGTNTGAAHPVDHHRRKDRRHHEDQAGERFGGLHALVRRPARPQRGTGRERGARIEVVDRSGSPETEPDRPRRQRSGRPAAPARRPHREALRRQRSDAAPCGQAGGRAADDGAPAHSRLPARSQHRLPGACHRSAGVVRRVQSSRSGRARAWSAWCSSCWRCSR